MPTLSGAIKAFIVKGLARYDSPSDLVESVKETFGVEITRQQVHAYDPSCAKRPASRWRDLHAATRAAYVKDIAQIGIAHKASRLHMLDRMARRAMARNSLGLAASLLKQAAQECDGTYDRRRMPSALAFTSAAALGEAAGETHEIAGPSAS